MKKQVFLSLIISAFISILILMGAGCRPTATTTPEGEVNLSINLSSTAFSEGGAIPEKYTCDGEDVSPPLEWAEIPEGAQSLVLIADDPDAPIKTWVHWVIFNIPASLNSLPEGIVKSEVIEGVGIQGKNDSLKFGYNGPCPPKGKPHRYFFKIYALDTTLDLKTGSGKNNVEKAMQNHILAQGQLTGVYGR